MATETTPAAAAAQPAAQTLPFQAEVKQLLHLVIHSLYSHREIFLRELVSNASDALDRLRFRAVTSPELMEGDSTLEIRLIPDEAAGTLTIEDTGVGMSHEQLVKDLGTIAHSGTREFLEQVAKAGKSDVQQIGQFGVGFYSAYLVADRVTVESRAAGAAKAFRWSSDAQGTFTVEEGTRTARGTAVTLHLKEDAKEFLQGWQLRELVTRYSDFVSHPIKLSVKKEGDAAPALEAINKASALWQRPKSQITEEQYAEFYKHLAHDFEAPLAQTHFTAEGSQQFTGLLFLPRHPPFDLGGGDEKRGVRLFVKRVLIFENAEELLPRWLRFVRGVVDSDDLPLNVSRELLQDSAIVRTIRKQLTKKVLDLLDKLVKDKPEDFLTFWKAFGPVLKEGLAMDPEYRERLGALSRWTTSHGEALTSLAEYVGRMQPEQPGIYYALGETTAAIAGSPHLEALRQRKYEILYLTDPQDAWAAQGLGTFDGKPLINATEAELTLPKAPEAEGAPKPEEQATAAKPLLEKMQQVLAEHVREVRISNRLVDSPVCLVVPQGGTPATVERLLRERGHKVPVIKRVLEVNAGHPLIQSLETLLAKDAASPRLTEWIELLHDQALLTEGSRIEDPNRFAKRLTELMIHAAKA